MVSQNRHPESCSPLLAELCELYGVHTGYRDTRGRWRVSPVGSIVAVLRALGADLGDARTVGDKTLGAAIRSRRREVESRLVEPVLIAWDGVLPPPEIHVPPSGSQATRSAAKLTLTLEDGSAMHWEIAAGPAESGHSKRPRRPARLPYGYHRLLVEAGQSVAEAAVISAPRRCWRPEQACCGAGTRADHGASAKPDVDPAVPARPDVRHGVPLMLESLALDPAGVLKGRSWGIFAPLYALRSERDWGAGDLAELAALQEWVGARGGCVVSTLPLLAMFFDEPFDPSPYRPVSRLFWNEFYLAVEWIPEWERCAEAREWWGRADTQTHVQALRAQSLVDYKGVMALKRGVLERLSHHFFSGADSVRRGFFARYLREHPHAEEYARFRAEKERHLAAEQTASAARYHLYCQWQMEEQLARLSNADAAGLFLDLPLGAHPDGFDVWRWPELFARGMSAGAPPDDFFSRGQDWTTPPLHPLELRQQGHRYVAQCLRHHMRHASHLRIDHVMSLHRLYWVPEGVEAMDGVYVTYPADELYAAVCLESHRNRTIVVGEDLGTVPPGVRAGMRRHGLLRTWVLQSSLRPRAERVVSPPPHGAAVSLNTHDMFPFAGFLRGDDIKARLETGQLDEMGAHREQAARRRLVQGLIKDLCQDMRPSVAATMVTAASQIPGIQAAPCQLLHRLLQYLAGGASDLVLVNLADLSCETRPQNLPGTGAERPNWRRKTSCGGPPPGSECESP